MEKPCLKDPSGPSQTATEKLRAFLRSGRYLAPVALDDYSSDYRSSSPLGLVETADMRHHRERQRDPATAAAETDAPCPPALESPPDLKTSELSDSIDVSTVVGVHFVTLASERCLHRYARREVCRRCIESCANGAIHGGDRFPHIDQAACIGCAACVSACPTGAINWLPSSSQAWLQRMQAAVTARVEQGSAPIAVFIRQGTDLPTTGQAAPPLVLVEAETIGMVGAAALLSAIALGAAGALVLVDVTVGDSIRRRLSEEIQWSRRLLTAWGFPEGSIGQWPSTCEAAQLPAGLNGCGVPTAHYSFDQPERTLIRRAAEHLGRYGPNPGAVVPLPVGTPFGAVHIDVLRCTLCMACAGACRMKALNALNGDAVGLGFTESHCVQCGACAHVCPEQAITLVPRMHPDPVVTAARLPLHQAQPARCNACGRVFASSQMLASIHHKLRGHWMYKDAAAQKRLQMCDRCRVQDLFLGNKPDLVAVESAKP